MTIRKYWLVIAIALVLSASVADAAYFSLEIISPRAAGTGTSAAMPSSHRIFKAYPGIEYNIRAAVVGGLYPFTYTLSGQPSGMVINSRTGEISWPSPDTSSGTITLTVTDAESTQVSTTWSVTVTSSTASFIFLQSGYSGVETGSITQPYSTLANLLANAASATKIVYVRSGSYALFEYQPVGGSGSGDMTLGTDTSPDSPTIWLAYPGETVTFTGSGKVHIRGNESALYFDGINFSDFGFHVFQVWGGAHYHTFRRGTFDGLVAYEAGNNNQGFIEFGTASGATGYYAVVQDNEFTDFTGSSAIGSLYDTGKMLIENNYIHGNGGQSISGIDNGISPKYRTHQLTVRGNKIVMSGGWCMGRSSMNGGMEDTSGADIHYNYFENSGQGPASEFQAVSTEGGIDRRNFYYYRNSVKGNIFWVRLDGSSCPTGPLTHVSNAIQNGNVNFAIEGTTHTIHDYFLYHSSLSLNGWNCIIDTTNLKGTSGIFNSDGKLDGEHALYVGHRGWQLSDGLTPLELDGTASSTTITSRGCVMHGGVRR